MTVEEARTLLFSIFGLLAICGLCYGIARLIGFLHSKSPKLISGLGRFFSFIIIGGVFLYLALFLVYLILKAVPVI